MGTLLTLVGNLGKITVAAIARAMVPIPTSVCGIFTCPNIGKAASVWDLVVALRCWCVQGCPDTAKESALKVDAGTLRKKSLVAWENQTCVSIVPSMAFQSDAPPTELSCPWVDFLLLFLIRFLSCQKTTCSSTKNGEWAFGGFELFEICQ